MAAANTDLLMEVGLATATTLDANYTINDPSVTVVSTSGMPTATGITFAMDMIDANGEQVPGSYNEFVGTVASATSINNVDWADGVADTNYTAGATTRVYIPVAKTRENRLVEWGIEEHNQDGTHAAVTATSLVTSGAVTSGGLLTGSAGLTLSSGTLTLPSASINQTALPLGAVVQVVDATFAAVATGTTLIPLDDTIPQITEGTEFMTLAITPKSATNKLVISINAYTAHSVNTILSVALFQDATANALSATAVTPAANNANTVPLEYSMVAGTTSATTFRVRIGANDAGTTTFNGRATVRSFGAIPKSSIVITEYKA